jgi:hypothetical protein
MFIIILINKHVFAALGNRVNPYILGIIMKCIWRMISVNKISKVNFMVAHRNYFTIDVTIIYPPSQSYHQFSYPN